VARDDDERRALLDTLAFQRASVLAIVDGLDETGWHTSVVPSGWDTAGLVEHLGDAERHWFVAVVGGLPDEEFPWDEGRPPYDPGAALTCGRASAEVLAYYRRQCARSDDVLAGVDLGAPPRAADPDGPEIPSVRWVVLHMIEETAAHTGHLEIARELLDGRTGLGLR
jgi:hypothetical protein